MKDALDKIMENSAQRHNNIVLASKMQVNLRNKR